MTGISLQIAANLANTKSINQTNCISDKVNRFHIRLRVFPEAACYSVKADNLDGCKGAVKTNTLSHGILILCLLVYYFVCSLTLYALLS